MGLIWIILAIEGVLAGGSAVHAMLKRQAWMAMWAAWHYLPIWWGWFGIWVGVIAMAERAAGRAADKHDQALAAGDVHSFSAGAGGLTPLAPIHGKTRLLSIKSPIEGNHSGIASGDTSVTDSLQ